MATQNIRFADFELDLGRYQLRRGHRVVQLEKNPMELLILVVEKQGRLVTREEISQRLWGDDVFVDTRHGINTAVHKLRTALHDDSERPRILQTVVGKGYRLVARMTVAPSGDAPSVVIDHDSSDPRNQHRQRSMKMAAEPETRKSAMRFNLRWWISASAIVVLMIIGVGFGLHVTRSIVSRHEVAIVQPQSAKSIVHRSLVYTTIDLPGAAETRAIGINESGQIVGLSTKSDTKVGTKRVGFHFESGHFLPLLPPQARSGDARGINRAGWIVGSYSEQRNPYRHGYLYTSAGFKIIDFPGAVQTRPLGINDRGGVVGTYDDTGGRAHGFVANEGAFTTIDFPNQHPTVANGISSDGEIVGQYETGNPGVTHGFSFTNAGWSSFEAPGAIQTSTLGIASNGDIAGCYLDAAGTMHGMVISHGVFNSFDIPGARVTVAEGINSTGQIVGYYEDTAKTPHGFLGTLK